MKTAFYHQHGHAPLELDVIGKNDDGTLNLGKDGKVLVSSCKLEKEAKVGSCAEVAAEEPAKAEKSGKAEKPAK